jgi:hypothetical protein
MANHVIRADHMPLKHALTLGDVEAADKFVNECPLEHGECSMCGILCCPHSDPFHFHHDGCPSCSEDEDNDYVL